MAAVAAGDWLDRNLDEGGRFVYGYDRDSNVENQDYNIVRHAGAMNSLYQLVAAGESQYLDGADQALGYLLELRIEHDDWVTIAEPGTRAKLGTVGFLVVGLVQRRAVTGETVYDDLMRALGRFIVAQQESDGSILAYWDQRAETPSPNEYGPFAGTGNTSPNGFSCVVSSP